MSTTGCGCVSTASKAEQPPLAVRQRAARATVGVGSLAVAGLARSLSLYALRRFGGPPALAWALAAAPAWFGASHLVAAATAYRGCPELGAIPSLVLRRTVETTCPPWDDIDRRLEHSAA
jgi:hypothetical protein